MYTATLFDGSQRELNNWQYSNLAEAKRVAKNAISVEEETSTVTDDEGAVVIEYRREGEEIRGYDSDFNLIENVD